MKNELAVSRSWTAFGSTLLLISLLLLGACGTLSSRAEAVAITASRAEVENCERLGPVVLGTFESEFDSRQRELRMETARKGGNVLLVDSFAKATGGTAYTCVSIDRRRIAS